MPVNIPPIVVFITLAPFMLNAGTFYPNLSMERKKLLMCHGELLNTVSLLAFDFLVFTLVVSDILKII